MNTTPTIKEAKRLYNLGFAIHWLHPKSKRPVESGWTTGERKYWRELKGSYVKGFNVGTRLGSPSDIRGRGFLAVIDVDVKSTDKRHRLEAVSAAKKLMGGVECPVVLSGRGNGSRHYYCVTEKPFKTWNPAQSDEMVKVYMPSKSPSKKELAELTKEEIEKGLRISHAWEISLYSDGRQVVVPPSIHPDSGKPYAWRVTIKDGDDLPLIKFPEVAAEKKASGNVESTRDYSGTEFSDFIPAPVDLSWTDVPKEVVDAITHGTGVEDRSAYLITATTALVSAGLTRNEILTVLTDKTSYLGACAYEHAKTKDQTRAAYWLYKYTVKRVMEERSAEFAFRNAPPIERAKSLSKPDAQSQESEIKSETNWKSGLEKTENGKFRNTINNCISIIKNSCGQENIVGRNEFAANDFYLCGTPWRSQKSQPVTDIDIVRIKVFCANTFNVEFNDNMINHALMDIADKNRFHPVREWLRSLKWDGVKRIDTWLTDYAGAIGPDLYLRAVSRKVLCAMVGRVMQPGIKFDHMLVLEGLQGAGKSTLLRKLASDAWFSDAALNIGDKDAVLTMQSKWLVEMGELSSLGKAELEQVKVFVTQQTDRIRAPYGKRVEEFPRQSVFIGTTNLDEYLRDQTGNRRFWPVKVLGPINFNGIEEAREQIFAEAVAAFDAGEPLYLEDPAMVIQAEFEQNKRAASDEWVSIVGNIITSPAFPVNEFEMRDVAKRMDHVGAHKLTHTDVQRLQRCFKILGCKPWRESVGLRRRLWKCDIEAVQARPSPSKGVSDENSPIDMDF